jgi:hypothetical protein
MEQKLCSYCLLCSALLCCCWFLSCSTFLAIGVRYIHHLLLVGFIGFATAFGGLPKFIHSSQPKHITITAKVASARHFGFVTFYRAGHPGALDKIPYTHYLSDKHAITDLTHLSHSTNTTSGDSAFSLKEMVSAYKLWWKS